jgi:hypothetical protein
VFIIPSKDIIIVRFGLSDDTHKLNIDEFLSDLLRAIKNE